MERNQIIGFVLIFGILMLWSIMNKPVEMEEVPTDNIEQVIETQEASNQIPSSLIASTLPSVDAIGDSTSQFSSSYSQSNRTYVLENDVMVITFNSKGGRVAQVELKNYDKITEDEAHIETKSPVLIFEDPKNKFGYSFEIGGQEVTTENLSFQANQTSNSIRFTSTDNSGGRLEHIYTITPDSYSIDHSLVINGIAINDQKGIDLRIDNYLDKIEKNDFFERTYSTVYYKETDENSDYCSCRGDDLDDRSDKQIDWVSFNNQFFNTSIIAKDAPFNGMIASTTGLDNDDEDLKLTSAILHLPNRSGSSKQYDMTMYFGPNEYKLLKSFDNELEEIIPFGRSIFGDINRVFIRPFFNWLSTFIGSKGLVIIALIFIIKMAVYPLTYKMLHSQAKMGALKPELAKMKERFKDDSQKQQMETMKVYREFGVSPFGGCMPMVMQIPIWYSLFRFFPASITFRQESFLWATDLSSYDVLFYLPFDIPTFGSHVSLFTILWAISTVLYTYYNMKHMDMSANPAMKYVQYLMPLMFFAFFNNYASGLTCYMFFSQMITVAQTILTKKFVFNDEKIMAELNIQKAKPKKKGSFQSRLEDAMKKQQKVQEDKKKGKK